MVGWEWKVSTVLYLLWPEPELGFTLGAAYGGVGGEGKYCTCCGQSWSFVLHLGQPMMGWEGKVSTCTDENE